MDISLFLSPKGRIARGPFWLGMLSLLLINMMLGAVPAIGAAAQIVLFWPQIALYVKRLHDFGWSGWMYLLPVCVSLGCAVFIYLNGGARLGPIVTPDQLEALLLSPGMRKALIAVEVTLAVGFAFLLWVGCTKGDDKSNRFGPAPQARQ